MPGAAGVPEITAEEAYSLGYNLITTHYTLKAAMDGMLEHGLRNFAEHRISPYSFADYAVVAHRDSLYSPLATALRARTMLL